MRGRWILAAAAALSLPGCVFAVNTGDSLSKRIERLEKRIGEMEQRRGGQAIVLQGTADFCGTAGASMEIDEAEMEVILREVEEESVEEGGD